MFDRLPELRHNCIGFAYFMHKLIKADYACRFPTPPELYGYFTRVDLDDDADTIGILGMWYAELSFVHLAVRHPEFPSQFYHRQNFYLPEPVIISARDIVPDGSHSTSEKRFEPGKAPVDLSFPEEKVFLRRKK